MAQNHSDDIEIKPSYKTPVEVLVCIPFFDNQFCKSHALRRIRASCLSAAIFFRAIGVVESNKTFFYLFQRTNVEQ
jgi:hypothetical protein